MRNFKGKDFVVYTATNKVNGCCYVGATSRGLRCRKYEHLIGLHKNNTILRKALNKYGITSFTWKVIGRADTWESLMKLEVKFIAKLKPEYNGTCGGEGIFGAIRTPEWGINLSKSLKGRKSYWKGKKQPPEMIEKRVAALIGKPSSKARKVVCLNDGREFRCAFEASQYYGVNPSAIRATCKKVHGRCHTKGLVFRFFGEHFGGKEEATCVKAVAKAAQCKGLGSNYKRPVICETDLRLFDTVKLCSEFYKISSVARSCRTGNVLKRIGLKFSYLDEWCVNSL